MSFSIIWLNLTRLCNTMTKKQLEKEHIGESVMVSILKRSHSGRELGGDPAAGVGGQ